MAIALRPMRAAEFAAYVERLVPDYAAEISSNYDVLPEAALAQARAEIDRDLHAGTNAPDHVLLCIVDEPSDTPIGYCWYRPDREARHVFVLDFQLIPKHRGKDYGKAALAALADELAESGFDEIRLRVAADNAVAQHVYLNSGFRPTGINMSKRIG